MTLELGGKSANVVFADADVARAAAAAPSGMFGNAGQDCCARSRILVERAALDEFVAALEGRGAGDARRRPARRVDRHGAADQRRRSGRRWRSCLGRRRRACSAASAPEGDGFWFPPTVMQADVDSRARARGDLRADRRRPAVRHRGRGDRARQRHDLRPVGQRLDARRRQGDAHGARDRGRQPVAELELVRAGQTPFGGFKQSGVGRELGPHALDHYTEVKTIFMDTTG